MISFISLMLTFTPSHVLAKVIRPSRFAFQMLFLYFLGNGPKCVMNLFAGYFRDPYPIICTGAVIFSISILQVYLYRQLCKRILPNLLGNGIRISYGQGDAQNSSRNNTTVTQVMTSSSSKLGKMENSMLDHPAPMFTHIGLIRSSSFWGETITFPWTKCIQKCSCLLATLISLIFISFQIMNLNPELEPS